MAKGGLVILFALFIDGLQAALSWAFLTMGSALTAATPIGAGAAGAAAGAAVCYNSAGNVISGVIDAVKCGAIAGATFALASPFGVPLGIGVGIAINICVSIVFGSALVTALGMFGMFDLTSVVGGSLFELIPGLDVAPGWTVMAVRCVLKAKAKEGNGVLSAVAKVATAVTSKGGVGAVAGAVSAGAQVARTLGGQTPANDNQRNSAVAQRTPLNFKNSFDGITQKAPPANANAPTAVNRAPFARAA
ncbi:MAG: hypothetical protein WCI89_00625 [bacterium]